MNKIENTNYYSILKKRNSIFLPNIDKLIDYCENFLPNIIFVFQNYTRHDIEHSYNVIQYMFHLTQDPEILNDLDITLLIYSALLHDIGMISETKEIEEILSDKKKIGNKKFSNVRKRVGNNSLALQELIRPVHAERSKEHIMQMDDALFYIPSTSISFKEILSNICLSHCMDFAWIKNIDNIEVQLLKGDFSISPAFISVLLRISDYLDIDSSRTPIDLFNYLHLNKQGYEEWKTNLSIENTCDGKIIENTNSKLKEIVLYGKTDDISIHRKLINYIHSINKELENAIDYSKRLEPKYHLNLFPIVKEYIKTENFTFSNFKLQLDYNSVTNLLMGENIYGDKKYGLRELIQNSIDACMLMANISSNLDEYKYTEYKPSIQIIIDEEANKIIIEDNGKGMTMAIVKNNFLNIGVSFYSSNDFLDYDFDYKPIGKYGIGFLSCFMLSNEIKVTTKHFDQGSPISIALENDNEFVSLSIDSATKRNHGTSIELNYTKFSEVFKNATEIESFIKSNFIDSNIEFSIGRKIDGKFKYTPVNLSFQDESKYAIDLSKYLTDINVFLNANPVNSYIIKSLPEIDNFESYIYDNETNSLVDAIQGNIANYITDNKANCISLYVIDTSYEDDFQKALDVLDDFKDSLDKIKYRLINIFYNDDNTFNTNQITYNERIIDNYYYSDFITTFDHSENLPTYIDDRTFLVYTNGTDEFIRFVNDRSTTNRWYYNTNRKDYIYIRNVYIKNSQIEIPFILKGMNITSFFVNINNTKIFPELSRNEINKNLMQSLNKSIGKALILWLLESGNEKLTPQQIKLIKSFMKEKYGTCEFIKDIYN